jgi:hypothetical protein
MTLRIAGTHVLLVSGETPGDSIESLTAVVNRRVCATVDLRGPADTDSDGNKVMVIGTADQPRECQKSGGTVIFVQKRGFRQFTEVPLQLGTSRLITNLAPQPPGTRQFGFLTATLTVDGVRQAGSGEAVGEGPFVLVLPASVATGQPEVSFVIPYVYPLETNGELRLALEGGDYLVGTSLASSRLEGATEVILLQSTQPLDVPVTRISIDAGDQKRIDLRAVRTPLSPISAPRVGDAGLK